MKRLYVQIIIIMLAIIINIRCFSELFLETSYIDNIGGHNNMYSIVL